MINKMRPDLLNDRMKTTEEGILNPVNRIDVRRMEGNNIEENIVTDILIEKGIIKKD